MPRHIEAITKDYDKKRITDWLSGDQIDWLENRKTIILHATGEPCEIVEKMKCKRKVYALFYLNGYWDTEKDGTPVFRRVPRTNK